MFHKYPVSGADVKRHPFAVKVEPENHGNCFLVFAACSDRPSCFDRPKEPKPPNVKLSDCLNQSHTKSIGGILPSDWVTQLLPLLQYFAMV